MDKISKIAKNPSIKVMFLLAISVWFMFWAHAIPSSGPNVAPDEAMRFQVPQCIYINHQLPTGYDDCSRYGMGNWSYAFYPQQLGAIVSAVFMMIVSPFKSSPHELLLAARMASVFFATIAVFFVGKTANKIFERRKDSVWYFYIAALLFAMWPQVAFLAGYVNNDIVALCGASIIIYACTLGYKDGWNTKDTILLAIGFVICLLGYSNSYGFILFGGIYFITTLIKEKKLLSSLKKIGLVIGICLLFAAPFFARNAYIYDGDFLGMKTFKKEQTVWENKNNIKMQKNYQEVTGRNIFGLVVDAQYRVTQTDSFIARFGPMSIAPKETYLIIYKLFVLTGAVGVGWAVFGYLFHRVYKKKKHKTANNFKRKLLFSSFIVMSCVTTVALSVYYTLNIDYQPQGRYIIYLVIPIVLCGMYGINFIANKIIVEKYRTFLATSLILLYMFNTLGVFLNILNSVRIGA